MIISIMRFVFGESKEYRSQTLHGVRTLPMIVLRILWFLFLDLCRFCYWTEGKRRVHCVGKTAQPCSNDHKGAQPEDQNRSEGQRYGHLLLQESRNESDGIPMRIPIQMHLIFLLVRAAAVLSLPRPILRLRCTAVAQQRRIFGSSPPFHGLPK